MLQITALTVQYPPVLTPKWLRRLASMRPWGKKRSARNTDPHSDGCVLKNLRLEVPRGDFLAILGSSGAGKTTLLRAIAGLLQPSSGEIRIDGENQTRKPPHLRDVAYVFQSGGWYDHLTVRQHFQLKSSGPEQLGLAGSKNTEPMALAMGLDSSTIGPIAPEASAYGSGKKPFSSGQGFVQHQDADDWMDRVGLTELADQTPGQLSGGQLQRLAIGRALARRKSVLLLDEPLSQLDEPSCVELRRLLKKIHSDGMTIVYVTHNHQDAFLLASRVAVLDEGGIRQIASPREIYDRPNHVSVAKSLGFPAMEFLTAKELVDFAALGHEELLGRSNLPPGVTFGIRPRDWQLNPIAPIHGIVLNGKWAGGTFLDGHWLGRVVSNGIAVSVVSDACERVEKLSIGDPVTLHLDPRNLHCFDETTGNRIHGSSVVLVAYASSLRSTENTGYGKLEAYPTL